MCKWYFCIFNFILLGELITYHMYSVYKVPIIAYLFITYLLSIYQYQRILFKSIFTKKLFIINPIHVVWHWGDNGGEY